MIGNILLMATITIFLTLSIVWKMSTWLHLIVKMILILLTVNQVYLFLFINGIVGRQ